MTQPEITDHLIAIVGSLIVYFAGYYRGKRAGAAFGVAFGAKVQKRISAIRYNQTLYKPGKHDY